MTNETNIEKVKLERELYLRKLSGLIFAKKGITTLRI